MSLYQIIHQLRHLTTFLTHQKVTKTVLFWEVLNKQVAMSGKGRYGVSAAKGMGISFILRICVSHLGRMKSWTSPGAERLGS